MSEQTPIQGIERSAAADAVKRALDEGLSTFKADLDGLKSKVDGMKPADLTPLQTELEGLKTSLTELAAKETPDHSEEIKGLRADMAALQNTLNAPGAQRPAGRKTIGEEISGDEGFRAFMKNPRLVKSFRYDVPKERAFDVTSIAAILGASGSRATAPPVLGATELGALDYSARRQEIVTDPLESVDGFVPMIPVVPTPGTELYDYRKETLTSQTGFTRTQLTNPIDGDPVPTNTCTVDDSRNLIEGTYVRFFDSSGNLLGRHAIVTNTPATGVLTFAAGALDFDAAAGDNVTSEQWGATAESAEKPYGFLEAEQVQVTLKTIAELIATTRQRLNSAPGLDAWIRRVMPDRLRRNLAWHLLYGTGTNPNELSGFASDTDVQTYLWSAGEPGDTRADAVLRAANLVVGRNLTIVMNKRDLLRIRTAKNSSGDYIETPNFGRIALDLIGQNWSLDGFMIIESDAVIDGDFFVIDFARASEIADQQTTALEFGLVNDQFIKNEITVRYESTLAHAILSTQAYVYGQWNSAP